MKKIPSYIVVSYHYIRDVKSKNCHKVHALTVEEFDVQLQFLLSVSTPLDPDYVRKDLMASRKPREGFLLSFDDGFIEHYEVVFPILKKYGLRGIFSPCLMPIIEKKVPLVNKLQILIGDFPIHVLKKNIINRMNEMFPDENLKKIPEGEKIKRFDRTEINNLKYFINFTLPKEKAEPLIDSLFIEYTQNEDVFIKENYLTCAMIQEMHSSGMVFSGHTWTHPYLNSLPPNVQEWEIQHSMERLAEIIGEKPWSFTYPYGHYNRHTLDIIRRQGVVLGLTTRPISNLTPEEALSCGRFDTILLPPFSKYQDEIFL